MKAKCKVFKSSWSSWENLFKQATNFATDMGSGRVISISHSGDYNEGVVVVWYWSDGTEANE